MASSDPIADMLTKIRNAAMAKKAFVVTPCSKNKMEICKILKAEGYIDSFKKEEKDSKSFIKITLKYDILNNNVIRGIERLSTPGRRVYCGYQDMPRIFNGYGILIVSTSAGIITGKKAKEKKIGGELICSVW